jgi:thioredoxin 1
MIKYLEDEKLEDLIKTGDYIVDFYADWCGPCKMMGAVLEKMDDVNVIKINTDTHQDLAISFGVMSIPTLIFFKDGKEVKKEIGFKDETTIRNIIKEIF